MRKAPAAIAPITPSVRLPLYFTNAFASTRSVNPQNIVLGDKNPLYKETMQYIIVMQDIYCILSKAVFLLENGKNERMKQSRIDAGLSQQQLADAVGATRQTIGLIEAGRYNPSLKLCTTICKTLRKTLDDLFWESEKTMNLIKRYNQIMGPKDERLEAEENKSMKVGGTILLIGSVLSLYYAIMLDQVSSTTGQPIFTALGEKLIPVHLLLVLTILVAGVVSLTMQTRAGYFSSHKRFAEVDQVPWDFVSLFALFCGAIVGILTCGMRIVAEVQIVGLENVAWMGDLAIGIIFFIMGFLVGFAAITLTIHDAIKRRRALESELED